MKKIWILILVAVMVLCIVGCKGNDEKNNAQGEAKVSVSMGYSLDQLGLKLSDESKLNYQQMKYNQDVNVNGNYTEVFQQTGSKDSLLALQGFYKTDLRSGQIFINGRTFTQDQLSDRLVFDNDEVVVYDISYYVFSNTLEDRITQCGIMDLTVNASVKNIADYIVQKNPGQTRPAKPQNTENRVTMNA